MYSVLSQEIFLPVIVTFLSVSVAHVFSNRTKNMVEKHKYSPALGSGLGDCPGCLRYLAIVHVLPTEDDGDDGRHAPTQEDQHEADFCTAVDRDHINKAEENQSLHHFTLI